MSDRLRLQALGRTIELEGSPQTLDAICAKLPVPFVETTDSDVDAAWSIEESEPESALAVLELWLAENADGLIFVHAGCVEIGGAAIVLPGRSLSGKSTLTAALLECGATYLSDEYAPLDQHGFVHPYPRPLSIRQGTDGAVLRLGAPAFGSTAATDPVRVALIATVSHRKGLTQALDTEWASRAQMVLDLLANTVPARSRPVESLDAVQAATRDAVGLRGVRGEAGAAARELLRLLDDTSRRSDA